MNESTKVGLHVPRLVILINMHEWTCITFNASSCGSGGSASVASLDAVMEVASVTLDIARSTRRDSMADFSLLMRSLAPFTCSANCFACGTSFPSSILFSLTAYSMMHGSI